MQHTGLVAARHSGLFLSIAGLGVLVHAEDPDLKIEPQGAVARFVARDIVPDLTVRARWTIDPTDAVGHAVFDSGGAWRLDRSNDDFCFRFNSPTFGPMPYKTARVSSSFTAAEVGLHRPYFSDARAVYPLEYPLDELLFIHLLARGRGVELHACGIAETSGDAHLFVGQSGAGKSTTARLWAGDPDVTILSDDRVIVREIDGRLLAYGTPWHGDEPYAFPGPAQITRLCFLRHGSVHRLKKITTADATARLFACSFVPFYDPGAVEFTLAFLTRIAESVPCCELEFAPDRSAVDFIRRSAA